MGGICLLAYTEDEKATALAVVEDYGVNPGLRLMAVLLEGHAPDRESIRTWRAAGIEILDRHREISAELGRQRKVRWQAVVDTHRDEISGALTKACEAGNYLGMQQAATAFGIMYDKLVPPVKAGVTVNAGGDGGTVNLLVVAPSSSDGEHRPVDANVIEGEIVE